LFAPAASDKDKESGTVQTVAKAIDLSFMMGFTRLFIIYPNELNRNPLNPCRFLHKLTIQQHFQPCRLSAIEIS
jgi:hypothetical protein